MRMTRLVVLGARKPEAFLQHGRQRLALDVRAHVHHQAVQGKRHEAQAHEIHHVHQHHRLHHTNTHPLAIFHMYSFRSDFTIAFTSSSNAPQAPISSVIYALYKGNVDHCIVGA